MGQQHNWKSTEQQRKIKMKRQENEEKKVQDVCIEEVDDTTQQHEQKNIATK